MVGKAGACEECARFCQLLHWSKKDLEPRVTRFFKIMIGHDFNEALFLPPKFVKTVKDLVDQETKLEDSSGACWPVTLSYYKGLLAFHKGWYEFSVDKNLKLGDFLVVNHIKGGHFVVQTFGKDGCEKLNAAKKHPPAKRAWTSEMKAAEMTPCQTTCRDARKRTAVQIQPTRTQSTSNCEGGNEKQICMDNELYLMVDRDAGYLQSDYRACLYDLSSFEMQQNTCFASKNRIRIDGQEGSPDHAKTSVKFQADGNLADNDHVEAVVLSVETEIASNTDVGKNNKDSGPNANMLLECDEVHLDGLSNDLPMVAASARLADNCIKRDGISNVTLMPQSSKRSSFNVPWSPQSSSRKLVLEPFTREEGGSSVADPKMNRVLKIEPVDSFDVPSTVAASFTCSADTNGRAYIDLPDRWPSVRFPRGGLGKAAVILEDPERRGWVGIYQQKFGFHVLAAPWTEIHAENGIQAGDHLVFTMADASLNRYKFDVVRKQSEN